MTLIEKNINITEATYPSSILGKRKQPQLPKENKVVKIAKTVIQSTIESSEILSDEIPFTDNFKITCLKGNENLIQFYQKICQKENPDVLNPSEKLKAYSAKTLNEIAQNGIPNNLTLKNIPEPFCKGVFLKPECKIIRAGSPIGIYSGELQLVPLNKVYKSSYIFDLPCGEIKNPPKSIIPKQYRKEKVFKLHIEAEKFGNFTRFVNHSSARPNVRVSYILSIQGSVPVYFALKDIMPGEQLLIDYSPEYWWNMDFIPSIIIPKTFTLNTNNQIVQNLPIEYLEPKIASYLTNNRTPYAFCNDQELDSKIQRLNPSIKTKSKLAKILHFKHLFFAQILEFGITDKLKLIPSKNNFKVIAKIDILKDTFIGFAGGEIKFCNRKTANAINAGICDGKQVILDQKEGNFTKKIRKINSFDEANLDLRGMVLKVDNKIEIQFLYIATKDIKCGDELKALNYTKPM